MPTSPGQSVALPQGKRLTRVSASHLGVDSFDEAVVLHRTAELDEFWNASLIAGLVDDLVDDPLRGEEVPFPAVLG